MESLNDMLSNATVLYMPVEVMVRELHAKLLLAAVAAETGYASIVGPKDEIYRLACNGPPGIAISFCMAKSFEPVFRSMKAQKQFIVAMDEEGLVTLREDLYQRYRMSTDTLRHADVCLCWGDRQKTAVCRNSGHLACRIHATGNPRLDLLRPELRGVYSKDVETLKRRIGPYLLINTNFGCSNHVAGQEYSMAALRDKGWMETPLDESYHRGRVAHQAAILAHFADAIPILSVAFPDTHIVIRPHPSESHQLWQNVAAHNANVSVIQEGNVVPWIMASEAVVHNGCTTAVEAYLLGIPSVAYMPIVDEQYEASLPNDLSIKVSSVAELIEAIKELRSHGQDNMSVQCEQKDSLLSEYLSDNSRLWASEKIVDYLGASYPKAPTYAIASIERKLRYLVARNSVKRIAGRLLFRRCKGQRYVRHKFPQLKQSEVKELLGQFIQLTGRFKRLSVSSLGNSSYMIY